MVSLIRPILQLVIESVVFADLISLLGYHPVSVSPRQHEAGIWAEAYE